MAASAEKLADEKFRNWVKSQLAILFTEEGLVGIVCSEFVYLRSKILQDIYHHYSVPAGTICTLCETPNVVPCPTRNTCTGHHRRNCSFHLSGNMSFRSCPNDLCHHIKDAIDKQHLFHSPSWRNTDATKWCTDEIEICKCFLPPSGYKSVTLFQELDLNGILTALISSHGQIYQTQVLREARDAVRVIRHSPDFLVSDDDVTDFLNILVRLLKEIQSFTADDNVMNAAEKIMKLQSDTLPIAITDINRVFDDGIKQLTTTVPEEMEHISRKTVEEVTEVGHAIMHKMKYIQHKTREVHENMMRENDRMWYEISIKRDEMSKIRDQFKMELEKKSLELVETKKLSTDSKIKEYDEIRNEKSAEKSFIETDAALNDAVLKIEACGLKVREELAHAAQHQIEMIKSHQTSRKDLNETQSFPRIKSEASDETSLQTHTEHHKYREEKEPETDILKHIYGEVPITVLLQTAKCNLPHGDYISLNELENVISNSKSQYFSSLRSMKEKESLVKPSTHRELSSTENGSQEEEQGITNEDRIQNKCIVCKDRKKSSIVLPCRHFVTCLDCIGRQRKCPLCRGAIEQVYYYQDVVDEQNSQDTLDETSNGDRIEEENDIYVQRRYLRQNTIRAMKKGVLPDQRLLNELCLEFGRKSKLLVYVCRKVSQHIKALDENILHVWAAYTVQDENKITFVLVVKENIRLGKNMQYSFIKRVVNEYSLEAEHVKYSTKEVFIDQNGLQTLKTSISNHAAELMRKHKYLSVISGSSVRSRNFGLDPDNALELVEQPCIVLYVHTKHFIPIEEEPFEELYDGVEVDVREGEFIPCVLANEFHQNLKYSCEISPDLPPNQLTVHTGSLGCFIDHPEYNLCGLTCAHVLLYPRELENVKKNEDGTLRWPSFKPHDQVYQPGGTNNAIGQLVQVIYQEGGNKSCGMEVALFQIDRRQPVSGHFPTMRNAGNEEIVFDSGKSCGFSHIGDDVAIKFGPVTDKTVGKFELETHNTSVKTGFSWDYEHFRITLHNQLCVQSTEVDGNGHPMKFADNGDSGSLVFKKDENGELLCVGIVEGMTSFGAIIVTPIKPILQKLGVQSIKSFEKEQLIQQLKNVPNEVESRLQNFESSLLSKITDLLKGGSDGNS